MKKTLSFVLAAGVCISLFAADIFTYSPLKGNVKSYTKTEYSIASKFGNYFRTPSAKFNHVFDNKGKETQSSELSPKDVVVNTISSTYNNLGNITNQVCTSVDGEIIWKTDTVYKNNLKTEISEYDGKNNLRGKTIFSYENGNLADETGYDGDGSLLWKLVYKYNTDNKLESVSSYSASGNLSEKEVYDYADTGLVSSITYFDELEAETSQEIFRYNENGLLNEITTYDNAKQITKRVLVKHDAKGNVTKISEYTVSPKFGTTVNELASQTEYAYEYAVVVEKPVVKTVPVVEEAETEVIEEEMEALDDFDIPSISEK